MLSLRRTIACSIAKLRAGVSTVHCDHTFEARFQDDWDERQMFLIAPDKERLFLPSYLIDKLIRKGVRGNNNQTGYNLRERSLSG
jgi:hypothetical protein